METGKLVGLILGPVLFMGLLLSPAPQGMSPEAARVAAVTVLMAVWWVTEAIPIPVTSLLPIALFPILHVMPSKAATLPYANHLIFLFMGGFLIAVTMEKWNLHRRIALSTISLFGTRPGRILLGFMCATAFLSMWVSNTATAMMMVPIGMAVVDHSRREGGNENFGIALMLGIAYSASIGGVGTIIGTPPNVVLVAMVEELFGQTISFFQWMQVGIPLAVVMLALTWVLISKVLFSLSDEELPGGRELIQEELAKLGRMSVAQKRIVFLGSIVATCWIVRGFLKWEALSTVSDTTIAVVGGILLFLIPSGDRNDRMLLDWNTALKIPWGIMLLFGGGLALADGFMKSGLAHWITLRMVSLQGISFLLIGLIIIIVTETLTELTSNTATATLMIPILAGLAVTLNVHPYGFMVACAIAASFAFMLPVATPPNAVVFGSGYLRISQMAKTGVWMNIVGAIVTFIISMILMPIFWGIDLSKLPDWAAAFK